MGTEQLAELDLGKPQIFSQLGNFARNHNKPKYKLYIKLLQVAEMGAKIYSDIYVAIVVNILTGAILLKILTTIKLWNS